jgi:hypothetical protein
VTCWRRHPTARKFYRGYDLVDPVGGGFASQAGILPSASAPFTTPIPGNGNGGHLMARICPMGQRLLAFLKTL